MKNQTITATPNYKNRTFTIRKKEGGKTVSKFRTLRMSHEEFEECEFNTSNDWQAFLTYQNGSYFTVK